MSIVWEAAGGTDIGRLRSGNEDALHLDTRRGVFLVADGMGGHAAGEVASALAATTLAESLGQALDADVQGEALLQAMAEAARLAHQRISDYSREVPSTHGMGTTLTGCVLGADGACRVFHIGDSRLYRLRAGALEQLTHDHTWVQREVDAGRLAPEAARNHHLSHILTRVLSEDLPPDLDLITDTVLPGDLLLLVTDGLYNMLDDSLIAGLLAAGDAPLSERVRLLIEAANQAGGVDNITAVLVRVVAA